MKIHWTIALLSISLSAFAQHEDHGPECSGHDDEHRHAEEAAEQDHADHDHDAHAEEGIEISGEMARRLGIRIHEAEGGTIARATVFPAEIKLNRDAAAVVSPRYAGVVREIFAEIGDAVRKGDPLASLENRETLAVYTVPAPLDGVVIAKDLAAGEVVEEGHVLYRVADLSTVWADISIFPQYRHLIRKGMPVRFTAHDGHTARGLVKYISPIVSHETRTFTARCVLEEPDEDFTPGAFVRASIVTETVEAAVVVPREAVQTLEGEQVVFVPGGHGFITVPVKTGLADSANIQILSGLAPGTRYVVEGAFALKAQLVTSGMDPHAGHGH